MQTISITNIMGHIGSDPQFATLPNGTQKATISVATNMGIGDRQRTQWHQAIFWGKAAEAAAKLKKGDALYVSGVLEYRKWTDTNSGQPREKAEINVQQFSKVENPMQTINQINILGNLGSDAQFKQFQDNAKTTISVATSTGMGDKQKTQWHTVILWGIAAEVTAKLKKGDSIFVSGHIEQRKWTDTATGQNREKSEIHAQQFSIISGEFGQISNQNYGNTKQQASQQQGYNNVAQQPAQQPQGYANLQQPNPNQDPAPYDDNYNPNDGFIPNEDIPMDLPY
ncbi:MAG: single-stranded DNA-binding protein [Acinetobacter sp.]|nr:single-stranded DNA-binding protein [Acinetobacter sp.]